MKLYAWTPIGFGDLAFYVVAENYEQAKAAVDKVVSDGFKEDPDFYRARDWDTDYYELRIVEAGEVMSAMRE